MNLATVETIVDIFPHPDPEVERLEIAKVLEYTCVVAKGLLLPGDKVILIQPDSVLPNTEWAAIYSKYGKRVRAQKICGFYSFGIVESMNLLEDTDYPVGTDVAELLSIVKYDALIPDEGGKPGLPFAIAKTDETNWQNVRNLNDYYGQLVDVTLKVDGQSCSFFYKDGEFGILSRNQQFDPSVINNYTIHVGQLNLYSKLASYCETHSINICLRGESYGQGIQNNKNNPHSKLHKSIAFYNVWLIDEMRYAYKGDKHYFLDVCRELELPTVDILEENVVLNCELIVKYSEVEKINEQSFEGVVIKGGDFSFKVINKPYDSKK
ncbi:RNA ligase family protein [Scytonema sp. NUACC26]|uniref:RNA ligase family protein n=1 Tax=Scytonema sp. NUACC26 TaxID=3140176 RepID=UPI0034DC0D70